MDANDIEKISSLDLYEILDIEKECNVSKIKKSYKKLVLRYHPDKSDDNTEEEFQLVNLAYTVLKNEKLRKLYDNERDKYLNSRDFNNLKEDLNKLDVKIPESKEKAIISFKELEKDLNLKHKFDKNDIGSLNTSEVSKRLNNLQFTRNTDDDNFKNNCKKLNVSKNDFNEMFLNNNDREIVESNEIIAYNSNDLQISNYSSINDNNLYSTSGGTTNWYSSLDKAFESNIPINVKNEFNTHNIISENDKKKIHDDFSHFKNNIN